MPEFKFNCPDCNQRLSATEEYIGCEIECPKCKKIFVCEKPPANNINAHPPRLTMPPASGKKPLTNNTNFQQSALGANNATFLFICPECNTQATLPISTQGQSYECKACFETVIAQPATEKRCPHCDGLIKLQATICKHCKQSISPKAKPPTAVTGNASAPSTPYSQNQWQGAQNNFTPYNSIPQQQPQQFRQQPYPYQNNGAGNYNYNQQPNAQNGLNVTIVQQNNNSTDDGAKKLWIYLLLAFFLGHLGIHDFYAGYTQKGVIKLIITLLIGWLIVPLIIVEIWVICQMITVRIDANGNLFE